MACLEFDSASGYYRIRFRYGGRPFKRSLKTHDRIEAEGVLGRVRETIRLLERGRLEMPPDADPGKFIVSDGKLNGKPLVSKPLSLAELFALYLEKLPAGAKEESTLQGEVIHHNHLLRHLKAATIASTLAVSDLQAYVQKRLRDRHHKKGIRPDTIKKELTTFRLVWNWAVDQGYLTGPAPVKGIKFPKRDQKPPFMTLDEIQRVIARGGLTPEQEKEFWDSLFLTKAETQAVLDHVRLSARHPFIYPMFVFAAHTGARRSEILRSQIDDFDFGSRMVLIREKKKSRSKAMTYRRVPMTDLLCKTMTEWFAQHPGGQYTICETPETVRGKAGTECVGLTSSEAHCHFKRTLRNSQWGKIKGFHTFRHSFASNLAAGGVDQRLIDEWMGHQTEEMRRRYRHLFPDQQRQAIDSVFGGNGK